MTDRGRPALRQSVEALEVGPSSMRWERDRLVIDVNEIAAPPIVGPVRGRIVLHPEALFGDPMPLDPAGRHAWQPFAPSARIEVEIEPGHRWKGHGYFDSNFGAAALEADFNAWTWARYPVKGGATCFYDAVLRDGTPSSTAHHFSKDGTVSEVEAPPKARLPRGLWTLKRETRADAGYRPTQALAMLDAPFYVRSAIRTQIDGEETVGVHEALDLRRFAQPWLKPMLAVRVPRRRNWTW